MVEIWAEWGKRTNYRATPIEPCRTGATLFRVVCAVQLGGEAWVAHAFQKKSPLGIRMPQREIETIKDRVKLLKEMLR